MSRDRQKAKQKIEQIMSAPALADPWYGVGGALAPGSPVYAPGPTRASRLPQEARARKEYPVASGVMDYFPDALVEVAHVSFVGNQQHNPGQPLHWDRSKSRDEADAIARHLLQRGSFDTDGIRHAAKLAWRALALLQKEIEDDVLIQGEGSER